MGQFEAAATGSLICQLFIFREFLRLHGSHLLLGTIVQDSRKLSLKILSYDHLLTS